MRTAPWAPPALPLSGSSDRAPAAGLDLVFQFNIEDGDNHYLVVKDGTC
ncbi:hypothetical protein LZM28_21450, partial [Pseudomonas aeruginosa]|nr:hypothetical protein [Pseudomonas aeruginosa]